MSIGTVLRTALLFVVALAAGGCTDFDLQYIVDDFRVLAIRAVDGPEEFVEALVIFDPELMAQLEDLEDVDALAELDISIEDLEDQVTFLVFDQTVDFLIEPLIVDPAHPTGPFRLRARACPWNETYRCDEYEGTDLLVDVVEGIEASRGEDLTFFFRPGISFLNAAIADDPFRGFGGLYLLLDIDIEGPSGIIRAAKTVSVQPAGLDELFGLERPMQPNRNPRLCGVRATYGPKQAYDFTDDGVKRYVWRQKNNVSLCDNFDSTDGYIRWDDPLYVVKGSDIELRPLPPLDRGGQLRAEEERYYTLSLPIDGAAPTLKQVSERLEIDLYVTAGRLDDDRAFTRSVFGSQVTPEFTWTVPDRIGFVTMWLVLRDNRGGVSWMERRMEVVRPSPLLSDEGLEETE